MKPFRTIVAALAIACGISAAAAVDEEALGSQSEPNVEDTYLLELVQPKYPSSMLERGRQGQTLLTLRVDETGHVTAVEVVASSHRAFSEEAVKSAKQWYFEPGKRDGVAISQTVMVPVRFVIEGNSQVEYASL